MNENVRQLLERLGVPNNPVLDHDAVIRAALEELIEARVAARVMLKALRKIVEQDPVELVLDPAWAQRIAKAAIAKARGG